MPSIQRTLIALVSHQHKQIIGGVAAAIALVTILVLESVSLI